MKLAGVALNRVRPVFGSRPGQKKCQVFSGAKTHPRPDSQWLPDSIYVCLNSDYSIIISICDQQQETEIVHRTTGMDLVGNGRQRLH